ncbi:MAG TPA: hypothetical protein PLG48_04940 [Candidatus Avimonas sp.]|nr:hypothetical protein [Candidatus Avimonas sp.]
MGVISIKYERALHDQYQSRWSFSVHIIKSGGHLVEIWRGNG